MKNLSTVMRLAHVIRRSAERYHVQSYGIECNNLLGWCALTSNILFAELIRRGIRSRLTWNEGHCFLTYGNYIIDITATQFDSTFPKVVKCKRNQEPKDSYWWWVEDDWENTISGRAKNSDWACGTDPFYHDWQNSIRQHLKTLK